MRDRGQEDAEAFVKDRCDGLVRRAVTRGAGPAAGRVARRAALPGLLAALLVLPGAGLVVALPARADGPAVRAPALRGREWINSAPLTADSLAGRVVLVEFWAF